MSRFKNLDFDAHKTAPVAAPAVDEWPDEDGAACLAKGASFFAVGDYESALTLYSRALRFDRDLEAAWVGQVRCLMCLGEYPEAVTWSLRAQERFPNRPELLAVRGLAHVYDGDRSSGQEFLDGAVQERSPSALVWLCRGEGLLMLGERNGPNATRCFLKAQEEAPDDPQTWLRAGMALHRFSEAARARPMLLRAVSMDDQNPLALYECGFAHEKLGEKEAAKGFFVRALALKPRYSDARDALERAQKRGVFDFLKKR